MHLHLGAEGFHNLVFRFGGHQQEVAYFAGLQVVEVVSGRAAFAGHVRPYKVQFHDPCEDCLGRDYRSVLTENKRCAEGRGISVVASVLDASQAKAATVEKRLELVEVE
ncbi:hypothetical protein D3C79_817950 [compost metagenome]